MLLTAPPVCGVSCIQNETTDQHARSDSNTQPADLESAALPIELLAFNSSAKLARFGSFCHKTDVVGHFLLILCSVCLRSRGQYFLRPSFSFSAMPPLTRTLVR